MPLMAEIERDQMRRQSEFLRELLNRPLAEWDNMPEPTRAAIAAALKDG
jgi:hypothetical protein